MSKCQSFDLEQLAEVFKALGNAHRLRILVSLSTCCRPGMQCCGAQAAKCVGELGGELEIVASTLSHHIKELDRAGLVDCSKRGKFLICKVQREVLTALSQVFAALAGDAPLPEGLIIKASPSSKE